MHSFLSRTLRGRLLILVLLVATSVCILAGLLIWQAYRNERDAVFRELGNTARATASLAEQRVKTMEAVLESLVARGDPERIDLERLRFRALRITVPGRRWVVVTDLNGQQLINTAAATATTLPRSVVKPAAAEAVAADHIYVSNICPDPLLKKPALLVTVGLRLQGALRYYASLVVSPEEFADGTFMTDTPPTHVISLVDRNGMIIARNHSPEKFIGRPPTPDIVAAARMGRENFSRSRTLEGRDVLAAVVPVPHSGWAVAVGTPFDPLLVSARSLILTGLLTSLVILAAATGVAWWIARAAIHDVSTLMGDTRAIADGRLPITSDTVLAETSAIAASLRATASRLHEELQQRRDAEARLTAATNELTLANQELEHRVRERTASLAELVRQMEEFTYSISHDLRSPLRAMTGFSQAVLEDHGHELPPAARDLLRRISVSGERMSRLIQDLLIFSRLSQQQISLAPVNLNDLARECVETHPILNSHAERIAIEGPLPCVLGHVSFLHQSLTNLLTNGVKFVAPDTIPRLRVRAEIRDDFARIWIEDNGIGINPALHSKLFQVFERLHPTHRFEGTGIGLAIVRRAIERMGGRVGVESDGVTGSRFWIELRLAPAPTAAEIVA